MRMAFSSFAKIGLEEFIERESAPGDLWIFIHIPKTAGSSIASYVDSPARQNKMFKFLAPDADTRMAHLFELLDDSVSFVGLTEMYPMSFNIIMRLFGLNKLPTSHKRKTEPTKYNQVERTPEILKRIKEANARDFAIYNFVKQRLVSRREQWLASRRVRSLRPTGQ